MKHERNIVYAGVTLKKSSTRHMLNIIIISDRILTPKKT